MLTSMTSSEHVQCRSTTTNHGSLRSGGPSCMVAYSHEPGDEARGPEFKSPDGEGKKFSFFSL